MMTKSSSTAPNDPDVLTSEPISDPTLRRFEPDDGLFLRAPHLRQISTYAEEFALAAAGAAGPGVDHGLDVVISGGKLMVSPGLAIDGSRRPLRLAAPARIQRLPDSTTSTLWIVEILAAESVPAGSEPVYGKLCDDPSSNGILRPWRDSAVQIRVRPENASGSTRNEMASAYFATERSGLDPWLPPSKSLREFGWQIGAKSPTVPRPVPIAGLVHEQGQWVVDTWLARRDVGGPPARSAWEGHLGLRPWNVFSAQILQFQAHLADYLLKRANDGPCAPRLSDASRAIFEDLSEALPHLQPKKGASAKVNPTLLTAAVNKMLEPDEAGAPAVAAPQCPFVELPPAGIVQWAGDDPAADFRAFFKPSATIPVTVEHVRADCALRALDAAQHLDRIKLDDRSGETAVRLLVSTDEGNQQWMVFVRDCCPLESVDVYVQKNSQEEVDAGEPQPVRTLRYPVGGWAHPQPDDAVDAIRDEIRDGRISKVEGQARSSDRRSLTFVRSGLIAFDLADTFVSPIPTTVSVSGERESIRVYIDAPKQPRQEPQ
jgi:hypothetical protein